MKRPDSETSRKHPVRPMTYWRPPLKPRTEMSDSRNPLVAFAIVGFIATVALTLLFGVILTGPDTHANVWNEVYDEYSRTEVAYVSPVSTPTPSPGPIPTQPGELSFSREVLPIFQAKCVACHGLGFSAKGISLTSYEDLMDTGAHEPLIVPGEPDKSLIVNAIRSTVSPMPPAGSPPEEQIQTIEEWIKQGARDN